MCTSIIIVLYTDFYVSIYRWQGADAIVDASRTLPTTLTPFLSSPKRLHLLRDTSYHHALIRRTTPSLLWTFSLCTCWKEKGSFQDAAHAFIFTRFFILFSLLWSIAISFRNFLEFGIDFLWFWSCAVLPVSSDIRFSGFWMDLSETVRILVVGYFFLGNRKDWLQFVHRQVSSGGFYILSKICSACLYLDLRIRSIPICICIFFLGFWVDLFYRYNRN